MSEYLVRSFDSKEAINAYLTVEREKSQMTLGDWRRALDKPIIQLASAIDGSLNELGVDLNSCWEDIPHIGGKVRRIGINWKKGRAREMVITESRIEDELARFDLRISYPDRSRSIPRYGWEVYTLSLQYDASEIVVLSDDKGGWERVVLDVSQMPVLGLQLSESPCRRLGLDPQTKFGGDYLFKNLGEAKRVFIQGVEQVCEALKEPNIEVTP